MADIAQRIKTLKSIVIYGGGMAGTFLAKKLCQSFAVTLVDSNEYFEIPMATPRSMVDANFAEQAIIPFKHALPKVQHIQGHLMQLNPDYSGVVRPYILHLQEYLQKVGLYLLFRVPLRR